MNFEIGLDTIDRNNGVEDGSVVSLFAPFSTNSERLLYQFLENNKDTSGMQVYFTLTKSETLMIDAFRRSNILSEPPQVVDLSNQENELDDIISMLDETSEGSLIIIDHITLLENLDSSEYKHFLNSIAEKIKNKNSIIVLYGSSSSEISQTVNRSLTEEFSDVIFEISTDNSNNSEIKPFIKLRKNRDYSYGGDFDEKIYPLKFEEDEVDIDTSRDIA